MKKNISLLIIVGSLVGFSACGDVKNALGIPIVSAISPNSGSEDGGTLVTITGENFDENSTVTIGDVTCGFETLVSENEITCLTGEKPVGENTAYNVVVTNSDGDSDTLEDGYTYENED